MLRECSYRGIWRMFSEDEEKRKAVENVLSLPHGIPCYSTFSRVMSSIDPVSLAWSVADFFYQLTEHDPDHPQHICIDGKALRAAQSKSKTGRNLYILNIFDAASQLFILQLRVGEKKQEAKEFERQAESILNGMWGTVTADALSARKTIVETICNCGMDAVLPIKSNNDNLKNRILTFFRELTVSDPEQIEPYVDSNGYAEDGVPGRAIPDPEISFHDEDNPSYGDDTVHPQGELQMYEELFDYPKCEYDENGQLVLPACDPENKNILWVLVNGCWVPLFKSHGRFERREYMRCNNIDTIVQERFRAEYDGWDDVKTFGIVTRYRGEFVRSKTRPGKPLVLKLSITRTPYVATFPLSSTEEFASIIRKHWAIETAHGVLDKLFDEDRSTTRVGAGPENCACIRKIAYNILSVLVNRHKDEFTSGDVAGMRACAQKYCCTVSKALAAFSELVPLAK